MKVIQVDLISNQECLTCWVDSRPDLKRGIWITLKDFKPKQRWYVQEVYNSEHNASEFDFHRKWDNNNYDKHKGLAI